MNIIGTSFFLSSLLLGSVYSKSVDPQPTDLVEALDFIKCTQEAIITGIPEAGIPSHNPLKIAHNFTYNFTLGLTSITVRLDNMEIAGLPWWNVTEAVQEVSADPNINNFKFIIYWPVMSFSADWAYESKSLLETSEKDGTLSIELDHTNFTIFWTSTKPVSGKNGTLDRFSLDVATKEAEVKVTNLGVVGDVIDVLGGQAVAAFFNNIPLADVVNDQLKKRLVDEWVEKPERIDAINTNCQQ